MAVPYLRVPSTTFKFGTLLTPEQVADLQIVAPTGAEDGLIGFWDFEEGPEGHISSDLYGNAPAIQLDQVKWTRRYFLLHY